MCSLRIFTNKLRQLWAISLNFLDLCLTIKPGTNLATPIKVLAIPQFLGGPSTKYEQLAPLCAKKGESYSAVFCFSSVSVPIFLLRILRMLGAKIVVNQNGVYYPAWYPEGWKRKNRFLKKLNTVAHHSFFQSQFAKETYREWVGPVPENHSILHNAVDLKKFYPIPQVSSTSPLRVLIFTDVSTFTKPVWEKVRKLLLYFEKRDSISLKWVFVGRVLDEVVFRDLQLSELGKKHETHFNVSSDRVPEILRSCHVALHLVYNDVCPNKVLECMASGLYVVGLSAGGTAELVGDSGKILTVAAGYDTPRYPESAQIESAFLDYLQNPEERRKRILEHIRKFDLKTWQDKISKNY